MNNGSHVDVGVVCRKKLIRRWRWTLKWIRLTVDLLWTDWDAARRWMSHGANENWRPTIG